MSFERDPHIHRVPLNDNGEWRHLANGSLLLPATEELTQRRKALSDLAYIAIGADSGMVRMLTWTTFYSKRIVPVSAALTDVAAYLIVSN